MLFTKQSSTHFEFHNMKPFLSNFFPYFTNEKAKKGKFNKKSVHKAPTVPVAGDLPIFDKTRIYPFSGSSQIKNKTALRNLTFRNPRLPCYQKRSSTCPFFIFPERSKLQNTTWPHGVKEHNMRTQTKKVVHQNPLRRSRV
jgi:hypothetical protein